MENQLELEKRILDALLESPSQSASALEFSLGIPIRIVEDILAGLRDKGLVVQRRPWNAEAKRVLSQRQLPWRIRGLSS